MSSKTAPSGADAAISKALEARLSDAFLPGDPPFGGDGLSRAADFVSTAAASRSPGEASVVIESVSGSAAERFMRVAVINDDMPFLVDSIAATISAHGLAIDRLLHPVVPVRRDGEGRLTAIVDGDAAGEKRESMVYLETARGDAKARRALESALAATLADVRAAVADWPAMQAAMAADADVLADGEGAALLRWFKEGMLTQLGHVVRRRDGSQSGALGICRKSAKTLLAPASFDRAFAWFDGASKAGGRVPLIIKSNLIANVHRHVPLDLFLIPQVEDGKVAALSVHAGVWTSAALAAAPDRIPRMRAQLAELMTKFGFNPGGHAGKALVHALTALPHDLLIGFSDADLERIATAMMSLVDRPRPRLALVRAPLERHLFAFVWLPRDALSTALRLRVADMLSQAAEAPVLDWSLQVEGSSLALIRFVLDIRDGAAMPDEGALDGALQAMVRGWADAVESEIAASEEPSRAAAIAARYAEAFPLSYRTLYGPGEAALDIARLRRLAGEDEAGPRRGARLHQQSGDAPGELHLKLYQRHGALALSDAVPALENFGFRVIEDVPTELEIKGDDGGHLGAIHDFRLVMAGGQDGAGLLGRAEAVEAAIAEVLNGQAEDDPFNRLITGASLSAGETNLLRAWYRYLRQAGMNFGIPTVVDALQNAPEVTRALIALFNARHDPAFKGDRTAAEEAAQLAIQAGLAKVSAINDDRLLRQYRALVEAMLRTNAFAPAGSEALAFKIDSSLVPGLPKPVPWREIFVYSRRVEGIHLRAGPVARGGLRWSDRRDDFRTEILGLMKAQRVKNAVIVPTGAKGGFYPKQLPDPARDRDGWLTEGKESYKLFIRTLLSITDNIAGGKVVHPKAVTIRDGEDPYFVVAADKGTATFSDTANALAEERDFWLDDAFASGGSKGYDHKAMGITAKGAWLSVRRHFLEMGIDVQSEPVRVAGCGDMSGDVFGNGMLLSDHIKLVLAFDHRHIFIDPSPDTAVSFAERKRLFQLPRSSWDDYDKALISPGGGVYPRTAKSIRLSPEAQAVLGIDTQEMAPVELLKAILQAPVDLIYNGGIGTYVKASFESHAQVGDKAGDAFRVNGNELRCKVLAEGGNLGCTQNGRIEYAQKGGLIYTDAIDNSAGVDCSDHEVNIKILLGAVVEAGDLTLKQRNDLLASMTDEVAALVLQDNYYQTQALDIACHRPLYVLDGQQRLMHWLEGGKRLNRAIEFLPTDQEIAQRRARKQGLTAPENAVLMAYAKMAVFDELVASNLPDDPFYGRTLQAYFPQALRERFAQAMHAHPLKREIIATFITNTVINRTGATFVNFLAAESGAATPDVIRAFTLAREIFDLEPLWDQIDVLDYQVGSTLQLDLLHKLIAIAQRASRWILRLRSSDQTDMPTLIQRYQGPARELRTHLADWLPAGALQGWQQATALLAQAGVQEALAHNLTALDHSFPALDLVDLAQSTQASLEQAARAYFGVEASLDLAQWRTQINRLPTDTLWQTQARASARDDVYSIAGHITQGLLQRNEDLGAWQERNARSIERLQRLLATIHTQAPDLAPVSVALRELRHLA